MRRQTQATGGANVGSSRGFRLDPTALPLRYNTPCDRDQRRREAAVYLDRHRAIVKSRSAIGAPLTVCLPISVFDGIAVRMQPVGETGEVEAVLELRHRDPALCLPLRVADDPADIADDWQMWSETLKLPLLLVDTDGRVIPVDTPARPVSHQRRGRSIIADRRPRFLVRRKTGRPGPVQRLDKREIIARS